MHRSIYESSLAENVVTSSLSAELATFLLQNDATTESSGVGPSIVPLDDDSRSKIADTHGYTGGDSRNLYRDVIIGVVLGLISLGAVIGNVLVIASVATERRLRTITNRFVVSLAIADMMVGALVLPPAIQMELTGRRWIFGPLLCDAWTSFDVMLCTASILNLCCISVDRYVAVTRPLESATGWRSKKLASVMITVVWIAAVVITCPPLLGWRESERHRRDQEEKHRHDVESTTTSPTDGSGTDISETCSLTIVPGYVVYSALGSFYVPLFVMIFVYANIFKVVRARMRPSADADLELTSITRAETSVASNRTRSTTRTGSQPSLVTVLQVSGHRLPNRSDALVKFGCCVVRADTARESLGFSESPGDRAAIPGGFVGEHAIKVVHAARPLCRCRRLSCDTKQSTSAIGTHHLDDQSRMRPYSESHRAATADTPPPIGDGGARDNQRYREAEKRSDANLTRWSQRKRWKVEQLSDASAHRLDDSDNDSLYDRIDQRAQFSAGDRARTEESSTSSNPDRSSVTARVPHGDSAMKYRSLSLLSLVTPLKDATSSTVVPVPDRTDTAVAAQCIRKTPVASHRRGTVCERSALRREGKTAKTLSIVVGGFVVCWLPFFVLYVIEPFCPPTSCLITDELRSFCTWLGYANSLINPLIYAAYNPHFRRSFWRLTFGMCCSRGGGGIGRDEDSRQCCFRSRDTRRSGHRDRFVMVMTSKTGGNSSQLREKYRNEWYSLDRTQQSVNNTDS